jgi:hypothetical protein
MRDSGSSGSDVKPKKLYLTPAVSDFRRVRGTSLMHWNSPGASGFSREMDLS